jgi:hypothetical protein
MNDYQFKLGDIVERINVAHPQYDYPIGKQFVLDGVGTMYSDNFDHWRMADESNQALKNLKLIKSIGDPITNENYDYLIPLLENI